MSTTEERMDVDSNIDVPTIPLDALLSSATTGQMPKIDEDSVLIDSCTTVKRFMDVLDQLDTQTERIRVEAAKLQERRDAIHTSLDIIKSNQVLANLDEYEHEEITCHLQRINNRLGTIELNVTTLRDTAQEDSLHQVNVLIDTLITIPDRLQARQRCQSFLICFDESSLTEEDHNIDKQFNSYLSGCTLDDQKQIRKRLVALNTYLNKQTISG